MSALFQRSPGLHVQLSPLESALEMRQVPHLYQGEDPEDSPYDQMIGSLFTSLSTSWMYSAAIQIALNGSQPSWSRDGWNFVPIDLSTVQDSAGNKTYQHSLRSYQPSTNISITTPAIRGRLQCSPMEDIRNISTWLTKWDLTNSSVWNVSSNPKDLTTAYELGVTESTLHKLIFGNFLDTSYLGSALRVMCCPNGTHNSAIGYWTSIIRPTTSETTNFTVKWVLGNMRTRIYKADTADFLPGQEYMLSPNIPSVQALNCAPIIEKAAAEVIVDQSTKQVHDFTILEHPVPASEAWYDDMVTHYDPASTTLRYGIEGSPSILLY